MPRSFPRFNPNVFLRESDDPMTYRLFGIKLALLRQMLRLTQAEAAQKIGIDRKDYERLEYAQNEPRSGVILKVVNAFGISFEPSDMETKVPAEVADLLLGRRR